MWNDTREISVFIDESGSFEPTVVSSRFYLVCLVFHNQSADISDAIARLEDALEGLGLLALGLAALGLKRKVA